MPSLLSLTPCFKAGLASFSGRAMKGRLTGRILQSRLKATTGAGGKLNESTDMKKLFESMVAADQTLYQTKLFHKTNYAVAILTPVAFVLHPSILSLPMDLCLAVVLPVHAHIGMNMIFTDYVPGSPTGPARMALFALSVLTTLGLIRLSFSENGVIGTVKAVWKPKEEEKPEKSD